jgi:hypothetical protein
MEREIRSSDLKQRKRRSLYPSKNPSNCASFIWRRLTSNDIRQACGNPCQGSQLGAHTSHHIRRPATSLLLAPSQSRSASPNCERSPFLQWNARLVGVTMPVCQRQARRATLIRRFCRRIGITILICLVTPCRPCAAHAGFHASDRRELMMAFPRDTLSLMNRRQGPRAHGRAWLASLILVLKGGDAC